jgi:hypothetical protein
MRVFAARSIDHCQCRIEDVAGLFNKGSSGFSAEARDGA